MTTWFDEERGALVAYMRLPLEVHEAVTPNEDDTYICQALFATF